MCVCTPSNRTPWCKNCPDPIPVSPPHLNPMSGRPTGTLVLVRGLPGSGKSTLAKTLIAGAKAFRPRAEHVEADQFFMVGNKYMFDRERLPAAHRWCLAKASGFMSEGLYVVVSNTFTTLKEMRPYFAAAYDFGIVPTVITAQNQFQNVHDVPNEVLDRMKARFQWDVSPLFQELATEKSYADLDGVIGT